MANQIKIVGMDPSMSNWGISIGILDLDTLDLKIQDLILVTPDKSKKLKVRQNAKDVHIAEQLYKGVLAHIADAKLVVAEIPVGSQNARSMVSYGMCVALVAALGQTKKIIQVSPQEVKEVVGKKDATKQQMFDWACKQHPEAPWITYTQKGVKYYSLNQNEHLADATAALYAGSYTPEFETIIDILRG